MNLKIEKLAIYVKGFIQQINNYSRVNANTQFIPITNTSDKITTNLNASYENKEP